MFAKKPIWRQPERENTGGRNFEYGGIRHADPMPRRTDLEPLPTIRCPYCGATMRIWRARQGIGYDRFSPNHRRSVIGKRLWICRNCDSSIDCWDGWEPPDMNRHLYKVGFFSTGIGRFTLACAVVALIGALLGFY